MKKNKGITLIALIITIIIMLILVAVSVNILIKSNLIGTAEKATNKYKTASEEEAKGGSITINGKEYESINEYIYGAAPKLKYVQEGSQIYVYLKGSYYDYIASKKLDEKEQLYAEKLGEASIEEVIKNDFNNSREEYEKTIQEETGLPYEIGLNSILVEEDVVGEEEFAKYYIKNVLKLKTDEEKEKELIRLVKETGENITIEELRKIINEQVSNDNYPSTTEWLDIRIWGWYLEEGLLELNLITPNGEEQTLSYIVQDYGYRCDITDNIDYISNDNTIKFIAEDYKGRTSELLVPVNANIKTFKVKISDTDIRTYKFIDGQTWEQFIGSSGYKKANDGSFFTFYDNEIILKINEATLIDSKINVKNSTKVASLDKTKIKVAEIHYKLYYICIRNGNNLVRVQPTDKIVSNTVYELETVPPE